MKRKLFYLSLLSLLVAGAFCTISAENYVGVTTDNPISSKLGVNCSGNQLTSLYCPSNDLFGVAMDKMIESLPSNATEKYAYILTQEEEGYNICTQTQVKTLSGNSSSYEGSEEPAKTYPIYLKSNDNGKIEIVEDVDLKAVAANTQLTVKAIPNDNCYLYKLVANDEDITDSKTFTVVDKRVVVTAVFKQNEAPAQTFKVVLKSNDLGKIYVDDKTINLDAVAKGTEIAISVKPNENCALKSLMANDEDITSSKKFIVSSETVVNAVFEAKTEGVNFSLGYVSQTTEVQIQSGVGNFDKMMKAGFAIKLPKSMLAMYKGAKIKGLSVGWSENRSGKCFAFITSKLGTTDIVKTSEKTLNFGWSDIPYDIDYTITDQTGDLYFGYYTEVGKGEYPIACQFYGKVPESCYAWKEDEVKDNKEIWADRVKELGMPYIRVILEAPEGSFENNVQLSDAKYLEIQTPGKEIPVMVNVHNFGINDINKFTIESKCGDEVSEKEISLKKPYAATSSVTTYLPLTVKSTGQYLMRISKVNDHPNNNVSYDTLNIISVPNEISGKYKRKIFVELFTSESSHKWPSVNKDYFAPGLDEYQGERTVVAHHMSDQYMLNDDEAMQLSFKMSDGDSLKIYRYELAVDRTVNPEFRYANLDGPKSGLFAPTFANKYYTEMSKIPAFASVNLSSKIENNKIVIDVTGDVTKNILNQNEKYYLTVYLTQDSVQSTSQEFASDEEKAEYGGKFMHNYLIREIATNPFGDVVELSEDGAYHQHFVIEPDEEWSLKNMHVVAVIGRSVENGPMHMETLNSNSSKIEGVESTQLIDGTGTAVIAYQEKDHISVSGEYNNFVVYDMNGEMVANTSLAKGVYLVKIETNYRDVIRKVIIK